MNNKANDARHKRMCNIFDTHSQMADESLHNHAPRRLPAGKTRWMRLLALLAVTGMPLMTNIDRAFAETAPATDTPAADESAEKETQPNTSSGAVAADTKRSDAAPEVAPEVGNLKKRDLSDAFKNFRPSEEISADNAVSFPVDI